MLPAAAGSGSRYYYEREDHHKCKHHKLDHYWINLSYNIV